MRSVQIYHLPDGPAQEARDASMRRAMLMPGQKFEGNPHQLADRTKTDRQFGCVQLFHFGLSLSTRVGMTPIEKWSDGGERRAKGRSGR